MEDPAHVVEQSGSRQQYCWRLIVVQSIQKELSVPVALCGRLRQPVGCLLSALWKGIIREI